MFWIEFHLTAFNSLQTGSSKFFHTNIPLHGKAWLNDSIRPFGTANAGGIIFCFYQVATFLQELFDFLSGHKPILSDQDLGFFIERAVRVQNVNHLQAVTFANFIVIWVVSRGDFQGTFSKLHINIRILDDWYCLVYQRNKCFFTNQVFKSWIFWMYSNSRICHNGFRPYSSNFYIFVFGPFYFILQVKKWNSFILVNDFFIGKGGECLYVPVSHSQAPVNFSLFIKVNKYPDNSF